MKLPADSEIALPKLTRICLFHFREVANPNFFHGPVIPSKMRNV